MVAYRSRQYFHQNPIARWVLIGAALLCAVLFAAVGVWNDTGELVVAAFTLGVVVALLWAPLTITVDESHVRVSFAGLVKKSIALDDITAVEARGYRPVKDFGGWGWRWSHSFRDTVAYTIRGTTAVVLTVRGGGAVYLGVEDEPGLVETLSVRVTR